MEERLLNDQIVDFLKRKEFLTIGTCDLQGNPNVAPKFLFKVEGNCIYLSDDIKGKTWRNIVLNPRASLTVVNMETLMRYQLNGNVELIDSGNEFEILIRELHERQVHFSAMRIIEGIHRGKHYENFEVTFPEKVGIIKIKVEELIQVDLGGNVQIKQEKDHGGAAIEKRKFIRHPSDIPIEVTSQGIQKITKYHLNNVGLGGLSFKTDNYFERDSVLSISIPFVRPEFHTQCRVAWCTRENNVFDVGVEFLESKDLFRLRMVEQICQIEHYRRKIMQDEKRYLNGEEAAIEWIGKYAADFPDLKE